MRALDQTECVVHSLDATIARIDYRTGELWAVTGDGILEFILSDRCRLWFNDRPAPFRCFHPLDRIHVQYADYGYCLVAEALYLWAEEPNASRCQ